MKITRCKYGHYYDKAYFRECPHCCRERGGRDEDIIIDNTGRSEVVSGESRLPGESLSGIQDRDHKQKEKDRENVKRWIGEAWDELEEILSENNESDKNKEELTQKEYSVNSREEEDRRRSDNYMIFAAMPLKVIKNQEFCMDFCLLPETDWETGAKMLAFKSQESIRDLKPVKMSSPANAVLHILYKDEEILSKEIIIEGNQEKLFCTFPVTMTDTRDRRFHMIKVVFEIEKQAIEIPLYLMPNP